MSLILSPSIPPTSTPIFLLHFIALLQHYISIKPHFSCHFFPHNPPITLFTTPTNLHPLDRYQNQDYALNCGVVLRECFKHQRLVEMVMINGMLYKFFEYLDEATFDISSDAFLTFRVRLLHLLEHAFLLSCAHIKKTT